MFATISVISIFLALVPALYFFKKHGKPMRVFALFLTVSTGFDLYSLITGKLHINNLHVLHVYTVLEYSFIAYFFSTIFTQQKIKRLIIASIFIYDVAALFHSFFIANMFQFNSITRVTECVLISAIGLYYFYTLFDSDEHLSLIRHPYFWTNSGVLLYFMGNTFLFMLFTVMNTYFSSETNRDLWKIHGVLSLQANIFYLIAFLWSPRLRK
jgi:hypothetical protein